MISRIPQEGVSLENVCTLVPDAHFQEYMKIPLSAFLHFIFFRGLMTT